MVCLVRKRGSCNGAATCQLVFARQKARTTIWQAEVEIANNLFGRCLCRIIGEDN